MVDEVYNNIGDRMWFGTERRMRWIETPQTGANVSPIGNSADGTLLDGGAFQKNSWDSHKTYNFVWPDSSDRDLASILHSYRDGTYGRGLIYFHDPMWYEINLLPKRWADPSMALDFEAPSLVSSIVPTRTTTSGGVLDLPVDSATYTFPVGFVNDPADALYFPVPPGYEANIGAIYDSTATTVGVIIQGSDSGVAARLAPLAPTSTTVTNASFSGESGFRIWIGTTATTPLAAAASATLSGLTIRLTPISDDDTNISAGPWKGGQGHSGTRFNGAPTLINYTGINGGQVAVTASFTDVGGWL